jgi:invasion protein IalB
MAYVVTKLSRTAISTLALVAFNCSVVSGAMAQDKPAAAPAAPAAAKPAAAAPAAAPAAKPAAAGAAPAAAESKSSWVKLCDKVGNVTKGDDGKEVKTEKNVCATFHDTIDANTGMTVVSAAIREVEGDPKPDLQVTVPLGMIIPAGARIAVLSVEQAEKLKKGEELDNKDIKQIDLKFTACLPNGCTAEIEAPQETLDGMKKGGSLLVRSIYVNGQPFSVPVPLTGFDAAMAGKATDNQQYKKARGDMMQAISKRRTELIEKFKAEQKVKTEGAAKELPPPPGAPEKK